MIYLAIYLGIGIAVWMFLFALGLFLKKADLKQVDRKELYIFLEHLKSVKILISILLVWPVMITYILMKEK